MKKEMIIVTIIIIATIILDLITQMYLNKVVKDMNSQIEDIVSMAQDDLQNNSEENKDKIQEKVATLDNNWNSFHIRLSFYIEHNELEKVDTSVVVFKGYLQTNDYDEAIPEMKKCEFLLNHIKDKESLSIINLF